MITRLENKIKAIFPSTIKSLIKDYFVHIVIFVILNFLIGCITTVYAQSEQLVSGEYKIKAAYIFNFLKFTEFSEKEFADLGDTIRITIFGKDPFEEMFDTFEGKTVKGKKITIFRTNELNKIRKSQLVYICDADINNLPEILNKIRAWGTLTVGEAEKFTRSGGIIGFYVEGEAVKFVINLEVADKTGIKFGAPLLQIAKIVAY